MRNIVLTAIIGILYFTSTMVFASSKGQSYFGAEYALTTLQAVDETFEPKVMIAKMGTFFSDDFSVEGRFGTGISEAKKTLDNGTKLKVKVDSLYGLYGVKHIKFSNESSVYGLIGVARVSIKVKNRAGENADIDSTRISYGVGALYKVNKNVSLNVEFVEYIKQYNADLGALGFGAIYKF